MRVSFVFQTKQSRSLGATTHVHIFPNRKAIWWLLRKCRSLNPCWPPIGDLCVVWSPLVKLCSGLIKSVCVAACLHAVTDMSSFFVSELEEDVCPDSCCCTLYKSQALICRQRCSRAILQRIGEACWCNITCKCALNMLVVAFRAYEELNDWEARKWHCWLVFARKILSVSLLMV